MEETISREARKEMPISPETLYLSWQSVPADDSLQRIYVLGVPRDLVDAHVEALQAARLVPYVMDLKPLADAARRLSGHLQQHRLGADIFLANPQGRYLGRTCPWKVCAPGVRVSCDARHCGQRSYLHDDWDAVRLEDALVRRPPIVLWPHIIARVPLPEDVEQVLMEPLVVERLSKRTHEPWAYDVQPEGRCVHCQRWLPVLELAEDFCLCAACLRQAADLLEGETHDR